MKFLSSCQNAVFSDDLKAGMLEGMKAGLDESKEDPVIFPVCDNNLPWHLWLFY